MNKYCKYFLGLAALAAMTACSDDLTPEIEQGGSVAEQDKTLYISMSISGDDVSSRAAVNNGMPGDVSEDGYAPGTTDFAQGTENDVNNVYFVFYDNEGNVVGDLVPVELANFKLEETFTGESQTIEKRYTSVVPVNVKKGEKDPSQVICYINPISPSTLQNPLSVIQTTSRSSAWSTIDGKDTKYFAMSNSVYYPEGQSVGVPNDTAVPQVAVKIPSDNLHTTESAAEAALGTDKTLNIYVERYATKLQFQAVDPEPYKTLSRVYTAGTTSSDTVPVILNFIPQYWAVNAESNRTYVIKSFRQESQAGEILPDNFRFSILNAYLNPSQYNKNESSWDVPTIDAENGSTVMSPVLQPADRWAWNNSTLKRSFWSMSPAYFTKEYPEVSSDLKEIEVNQKYIKYSELAAGTIGFKADNNKPQYFRETTVGYRALNSSNPNAAVASVIYVGQYKLKVNGTELKGTPSFYTYLSGPVNGVEDDRPYVYFDGTVDKTTGQVTSNVEQGESMLLRFLAQATILYRESTEAEKLAGGGDFTRLSIANSSDIKMMIGALNVSEVSDEVKVAYDGKKDTKLKLQNNSRTLQFTSVKAASKLRIVTGGGYMEIVADDATDFDENTQIRITDANVTLMRQVGLAYYYKTGHAYYSIPVKHFGWYRKSNLNRYQRASADSYETIDKLLEKETLDWSLVRVGDFGMVRNHSYSIDVKSILGLAQGIGDDDNPIVPPANTKDYYLAYSVNILRWAVVPTQTVNL